MHASSPIGFCLKHPAGTKVLLLWPGASAADLAGVSVTVDGVTLDPSNSTVEPLVEWRGVPFPASLARELAQHAELVQALCHAPAPASALRSTLRELRRRIERAGYPEACVQMDVVEALVPAEQVS